MIAEAIEAGVRPRKSGASYAISAWRGHVSLALTAMLLLLLAGCNQQQVEEEDEVDCYPSFGIPEPACVSLAFYHRHPAWHPGGQQISYLRPRRIVEDSIYIDALYIFDLTTGTEHHVIDVPLASMSSQSWSPDGEWLTFGAARQIYKIRPDGSDLTQLTFSRENFSPAWSPNGEWIAYDDATPSAPEQGTYIIRPDGSKKRWLPHVSGGHPTWHPTSDRILTIGHNRLLEADLAPSNHRDTLLSNVDIGFIYHTTYSPNGNYIVYDIQYRHKSRSDLFKLNSSTKEIQKLTGNPAISFGAHPAWSPDGGTIAYVNSYWREAVIWLMNADGSNQRRMGPTAPDGWLDRL